MKLVILNGASCSGKSTVVKNILKQKERYFHLSYDSIKWQFSQYEAGKYYKDIHEIMFSVLDTMCKLKYNVVSGGLYRTTRQSLINIATQHGYEVLEINLEADYEVLSQRFKERVADALANPKAKIANLSKERFAELYEIFQGEKNPSAVTFRTDTQNIEEVLERVMKLL